MGKRRIAYVAAVCVLLAVILADVNSWYTWVHPALPIDVDAW